MSEFLQSNLIREAYALVMMRGPERQLGDGDGHGVATLDRIVPGDAPSEFVAVDGRQLEVPVGQERLRGPFSLVEYLRDSLGRQRKAIEAARFTVRVVSQDPILN